MSTALSRQPLLVLITLHLLLGNRSCSAAAQVPQQILPTGSHCQQATSVFCSAAGQGCSRPHPLVTVSEGALRKWLSQGSVVRWSSGGSELRGRSRPSPGGPPAYPASGQWRAGGPREQTGHDSWQPSLRPSTSPGPGPEEWRPSPPSLSL